MSEPGFPPVQADSHESKASDPAEISLARGCEGVEADPGEWERVLMEGYRFRYVRRALPRGGE